MRAFVTPQPSNEEVSGSGLPREEREDEEGEDGYDTLNEVSGYDEVLSMIVSGDNISY